jgi:hypothetical protein
VTDEEAAKNRARLVPRIAQLSASKSPCYEMEGFPNLPRERAQTFRVWLIQMSAMNARISAVQKDPDSVTRADKARALITELTASSELSFVVAYELVKLLRDAVGWQETIAFIDRLPEALQARAIFAEQRALARSKQGDHLEAIGALEQLVALSGESPERRGLLGGRYKKLWRQARETHDAELAGEYLEKAIENYETGRKLDLNEYYAASNLPILLRMRGGPGDSDQAARIGVSVVLACERAIERKTSDEWVYPTLLVAAFNAGDRKKAEGLAPLVRRERTKWKLDTTLADLLDSVELKPAGPERDAFQRLLDSFK